MFLQENTNTSSKVVEKAADVKDSAIITFQGLLDAAHESIHSLLLLIAKELPLLAAGAVVLLIFWIVGKIIKAIFLKTSKRTHLDDRLRILFSRLIGVMIFILGIFAAMTIIIPNFSFGQLIAGLGFTSFIIGFATKDILTNLLSGILILWNQPFQIGDYIFIKDNEGEVEYIGVRATNLKMNDGEIILIPNGDMYSNALVVRRAGAFRRMTFEISIGYKSKVVDAKENILNALAIVEGILEEPAPSVYVTDLATEGIDLTIYFWVNTDENSPLKVFDAAASGVNRALREIGIEIYPSRSVVLKEIKEPGSSLDNNKEIL